MRVYKGLKIKFIEVISNEVFNIDNKKYYNCKCDCGNEKLILKSTIESGRIRDCGCGEFARTRLIGKRFGKLVVVDAKRNNKTSKKNIMCVCKCDCGNTRIIPASNLNSGSRVSCGCVQRFNFDNYKNKQFDNITIIDLIDKEKKIVKCKCVCGNIFNADLYKITTKEQVIVSCGKCSNKYNTSLITDKQRLLCVFRNMVNRCYNINAKDYKWYGLKGVKICKDWLVDKSKFVQWAINNGYSKGLTLDRIDTNGNYEPSNCRWVTIKQQQNNRCNNVKYLYKNKILSLLEISNECKINIRTLRSRLRSGMSLEEATTKPIRHRG